MSKEKIKIVFVLPSLAAGGAERILSFVAQHLDKNIFEATLLITGFEKDTVYKLNDDLRVTYLNKTRVLKSIISLFSYFKSNKPDIVVSSIVHLNTVIAFLSPVFPKIKFVSREANVLTTLNEYNPYTTSIFPKSMVKLAYKLVDCIICQSKDMQKDMVSNYNVPFTKTVLINNPITKLYPTKETARDSSKPIKFITVGRLSKEKGYDRIIDALSKVTFKFTYTIIGDGTEKEFIFNLIEEKGLKGSINYISYTDQVAKYLSESDLFLQGSYVEGFPNVLIESCVVGTPILAFNAPGGLDEIIEFGKNGYVVETSNDYIQHLNKLNNEFAFEPNTVSSIVKDKFSYERIMTLYNTLFNNLFHNKINA